MTYAPAPSTQPMTHQHEITCVTSVPMAPLPKRHHAHPGNTSPNDFQAPWQFRHPSFPLIIFKPPFGVGKLSFREAVLPLMYRVREDGLQTANDFRNALQSGDAERREPPTRPALEANCLCQLKRHAPCLLLAQSRHLNALTNVCFRARSGH